MKNLIVTCLMASLFIFGCAHNETDVADEGAVPEINQAQDAGATSPQATPVAEKPIVESETVAQDSKVEVPPPPVKKVVHKKKRKKHVKKHVHHKKHKKQVVKKTEASDSMNPAQ
jgi:hypothetical protein